MLVCAMYICQIYINPIRDGGGGKHIVPAADSFVCCGSIRDLEKVDFSGNS